MVIFTVTEGGSDLKQSLRICGFHAHRTIEPMPLKLFILSISVAVMPLLANAQFCPSLGPDIELPCGEDSATLTADLTDCPAGYLPRQTNAYTVSQIPFAPSPATGTTITLSDDAVSQALPIGFSFCFYGNTYTQFYIGSNGWVGFSPGQPTTFTSAPIPSTAGSVPKNCIMGPWQDWHPGIAGGPYIRYQTIGQAPCRKLVVSFSNIPFFSCTTTLGTFQIVLNEGSNIIENHLTNKPSCTQWAGGTAVQGVHNQQGTAAVTVPGRNSTVWTATNDAWQWVPNGAAAPATYVWYEVGNPTPIATGPQSITVTPPQGGAEYTVQLTYTGCYGLCNTSVEASADTVLVTPGSGGLEVVTSVTSPFCNGGCDGAASVEVSGGTPGYTYLWLPSEANTPSIENLCAGAYSVTIIDEDDCQQTVEVIVENPPPVDIGGPISHD